MRVRTKRVLDWCVVALAVAVASGALEGASGLRLETATIDDLNAAFNSGALTSEQLVEAYLKRIEAYDKQGPTINAVITPNPNALTDARPANAQRRARPGPAPLHAVPPMLKNHYNPSR